MSIAVLSNVTAASLALRAGRETGEEIYTPAGYNTWLQEIADPASDFYRAKPQAAFIVLDGRELLGPSGEESASAAEGVLAPLPGVIAGAAARTGIIFVVSTIDIPQRRVHPLISKRAEPQAAAFWRRGLEEQSIPILELAEIASETGRGNFYNKRVWYMGGMPFSQAGEKALALEIGRIWNAIRGRRKKCLALDLDNTLWGGVIGEAGAAGIELGTTGAGARYYDMQRRILDLKNQGALLAILSKNNLDDAIEGIEGHPSMLLRRRDFAAIRANWNPKPENLASIAKELNIGPDAFVFIDDSPLEREAMQIALPQVAVPAFPEDTAQLERFMIDVAREHFLLLQATTEDLGKTEQYLVEERRREQRSSFASVGDYLQSLGMALSVERLNPQNLPRASQLTQKTNQFNLTTRRYNESEMRAFMDSRDCRVYIGGLADKFGDYGKIILCIARTDGERAEIDTFLMSCRAMGRTVERAFLRHVEEDLASSGVENLAAIYIPTPKNGLTERFWPDAGYRRTENRDRDDEKTVRYEIQLPLIRDNDSTVRVIKT